MFGGINPGQMKAMMSKMGIKQEEIDAVRVIIEKSDSKIIIEPVNVIKMTMQGQSNFQITGEVREETKEDEIKEEDIQMVMEKTGIDRLKAENALKGSNGDIAQAIIGLSG